MTASLAVSRQILQSKSLEFEGVSSSEGASPGATLSDAIRQIKFGTTKKCRLICLVIRDSQLYCAGPNMSQGESNRWSSVTLDTLLLHDGLQRVTDLVELPDDVQQGSSDQSVEIISFDSNNPQELAEQLKSFCSKRNLAYGQLLQYRLNAIVGLWRSQRDENKEEPVSERDRDTDDERSVSETVPFTSRVSLLLVFPLLEHESSTRPELRIRTSRLLLDCLTDYPPLALIREPKDCFSELETLLCDWLGRERDSGAGQEEIETTTACLVALACAR